MLATCWAAGAEVLARAVVAEPRAIGLFQPVGIFLFPAYHLLGLGGGGRWDVVCIVVSAAPESAPMFRDAHFDPSFARLLAVVEAALALAVEPSAASKRRDLAGCSRSS